MSFDAQKIIEKLKLSWGEYGGTVDILHTKAVRFAVAECQLQQDKKICELKKFLVSSDGYDVYIYKEEVLEKIDEVFFG